MRIVRYSDQVDYMNRLGYSVIFKQHLATILCKTF